MGFVRSLLIRKTRSKGSEAVEEALAGFEEVISNLSSALSEADDELTEAQATIEFAVNERDRVEEIRTRGVNFINGLRTLLQG